MTNLTARVSAILTASALLAAGLLAGGAETASADASTCYQSSPSSTTATVKGFDINEGIGTSYDFAGTRAAGYCFVYIKASGGVKVTNANFDEQWSAARSAGLLTGTYHLAAPNTGTGAQQAAWFLGHDGQWSDDGATLPPALDMEVNTQQSGVSACYDMTPQQLTSWVQQFLTAVQTSTSRRPVIYTNQDFWQTCMGNTSALDSSPLWVASYASKPVVPSGFAHYAFWQTAGSATATQPDKDVFNGTLAQLERQTLADASASHDYSGDGLPDVLTTTSAGALSADTSTGIGKMTGLLKSLGITIPNGSHIVVPGDMNNDGLADLYAVVGSGKLVFWAGQKGGGFAAPVSEGTGWNTLRAVIGVGDFTGDGDNDLLALTKAGQVWLYPGNGKGGLASHQQIASGLQTITGFVGAGDLTGDGRPDLLVRTSAGQLWIFPRTATGFGGHITGPSGMKSATSIFSVGDFTGDGHDDILIRSGGQLEVLAGAGNGTLGAPTAVSAPGSLASSQFVG